MKIDGFKIKKGKFKLDVPSMDLSEKGIYILSGLNGTGKTTFIETILKENRISDISVKDKQFNISYFSQSLYRYNIKASDYLKRNDWKLVDEYCKVFNIDFLDKNIQVLSGGEFVLLSIVRTLSKNTPILIFDEPSNNLDNGMTEKLKTLIESLRDEKIMIISTHDPRMNFQRVKKLKFENNRINFGEGWSNEISGL